MKAIHLILSASLATFLQPVPTSSLPDSHEGDCLKYRDGITQGDDRSTSVDSGTEKTIKIGLLIQDRNSPEALQASELAIKDANLNGGYRGRMFELKVRSMEGPWGTGSKQAVSLVFDEKAVALVGSHDGRNAHLVEQVAAKAGVVFVSAWSGDPTLAQAFVPWFFNSVYNDCQLSDALVSAIYRNNKPVRLAVITDDGYDSASKLKCFLGKLQGQGKPEPLKLGCNNDQGNINEIADKLKTSDIDCIVLIMKQPGLTDLIKKMRTSDLLQPVYCPLIQIGEDGVRVPSGKIYENVTFINGVHRSGKPWITFSEKYRNSFGTYPGAVAACAFDAMNLLIEAVRIAGTDREKLQEALKIIKYEGVTGLIRFDDNGNRKGTPGLEVIRNGIPVNIDDGAD